MMKEIVLSAIVGGVANFVLIYTLISFGVTDTLDLSLVIGGAGVAVYFVYRLMLFATTRR